MKRILLLAAGILCSLLSIQAFTVTYTAIDKPEGWDDMTAWTDNYLPSGSTVALGASVTFRTPGASGYAIDWYVNGVKIEQPVGFTYSIIITASVHVEARYREAYKFIFQGTPYVRYANEKGYATLTQNFYHTDHVSQKGIGHTVDYWTGSNGKNYAVDRTPNDNLYVSELLTSDVVLTPHYVLSGKSIGDSTVVVTWRFDQPANILLLRDMKEKAPFVQTAVFQGVYTDIAMTIDATAGRIDNYNNGMWNQTSIPAQTSAGTRMRLPSTYGTLFRVLTKEPLTTSTTIAGKSDYTQSQLADGSWQSLIYCYNPNDTVDMVIGEDISLISIAAMYPGANNTLTWRPVTGTGEPVINTAYKIGEAGGLLRNMSNIANIGMLQITPSVANAMTSLIEMPQTFNEWRSMAVGFEVADGYAFLPTSAEVPFFPVVPTTTTNPNILSALWLEDEHGLRIDSLFTNRVPNVLNYDSLTYSAPADYRMTKFMRGKVTMRIFVFGTAAQYRLGEAISISGSLYRHITFPEDSRWMPLVITNAIDFDGTELQDVEVYEAVGVRERTGYLSLVPVEECPPGTIVMLRAPNPGAEYFVPLTHCDDAFDPKMNILHISDGTVTGNSDRYVYELQDGRPVFVPSKEGETIPEGNFYIEYEFMATHDVLYISDEDPSGIDTAHEVGTAPSAARRIIKDGRIYIVKPDGTMYNIAGCRVR